MLQYYTDLNIVNKSKQRIEGFLGGQKTLIIVDWDDTLLPTTWLSENEHINLRDTNFGIIVAKFLEKAINLGNVVIITNADPRWVYETSEKYLPEILIYLRVIPICSARQFAINIANDVVNWKYRAFNSVIQEFNKRLDGIKCIVSIGDSYWDRDAIFSVFENNKRIEIIPKAVKFLGSPSFEILCEQIMVLTLNLEDIVIREGAKVYEMRQCW